MTHGMPDYNRDVRPKYGGAKMTKGVTVVDAGRLFYFMTVNGKGMIYGGNVWLDAVLSQSNDEIWVVIDGFGITTLSFLRLYQYGMTRARTSVVSINTFDDVNNIYSVGLSYGITFEETFRVGYRETYDRTPTVHFEIIYALM